MLRLNGSLERSSGRPPPQGDVPVVLSVLKSIVGDDGQSIATWLEVVPNKLLDVMVGKVLKDVLDDQQVGPPATVRWHRPAEMTRLD